MLFLVCPRLGQELRLFLEALNRNPKVVLKLEAEVFILYPIVCVCFTGKGWSPPSSLNSSKGLQFQKKLKIEVKIYSSSSHKTKVIYLGNRTGPQSESDANSKEF